MPLTVGVLIIGSLYWKEEGRERWRDWRLDTHHKWLVKAPIRYGRRSENKTYTMVFDSRLSEDQLGQAIVVQCKRAVSSASDLIAEAEWLWSAEEKNKVPRFCISSPEHRISPDGEWGCVALLVGNPHKEIPQQLLDDWAKHVAGEVHYHANERRSVNDQGILQIGWPHLSSDDNPVSLDLLLVTSNDQEPWPTYPTVKEIADAWNQHPQVDYFRSNRKHAIETFQDQQIEKLLR